MGRRPLMARDSKTGALLVLDEVQKIFDWSTVVKLLWDADTHAGLPLKVVARFCAIADSAWFDREPCRTVRRYCRAALVVRKMREAFGWNLEQYIFYGAYPGSAELITEPERWRRYVVIPYRNHDLTRHSPVEPRGQARAVKQLFHLGRA